jgi:hypothetical protein
VTERAKLLECARTAARGNLTRYRPGMPVDLSYLDSASDERLRAIVRSWFGHTDLDACLADSGPFIVA